jgi:hypothetical protein
LPPGKFGLSDVIQVLPQVAHSSIFSHKYLGYITLQGTVPGNTIMGTPLFLAQSANENLKLFK